MSEAFGAIANLMGSALTNATNQDIADNWQALSASQQQFLRDQLAKIEAVKGPNFIRSLPPAEQLQLQKYMDPILAQSQGVSIDPNDRASQMAALNQMQSLANGNANSELNAANYKAMANAGQQQHSSDQAILQSLAQKGTLGSGQELAARMQAAQNSANNSQAGMLQAAQNNALERMQGNNQYLQGLSSLRGQDTDLASKNADIINQFNLANTAARNNVNQMNTNVGNQQSLYNTNLNNQRQMDNTNLYNSTGQQSYQDALGQAQAAAGEANTISSNALSSGATQGALNAHTAAGIAQGIGDAGNAISSALGKMSSGSGSDSSDPYVEQAPEAQEEDEGTSFDGT